MQLASLSEQPLHPGYGFAVVDRSGTVLYHSDTRLPLRENLFAEVSEPLKLQAAMLAGLERELTLSYYARPHRFYVDPMDYLQGELAPTWTLVTFRDLSIGRSAAVQALTLAILWPLPLLVLLGGIALYVFSNLKIPHRGAWLWPQESKRSRYIWISLWLAVSALASQSWDTASWGLLIVALVTAVPIYAAMRRVPDSDRQPLQSIAWHRVFLLLVVFQLAVIPARGVFRVIWSDQMGKLYAYEQGTLAARKADFRRSAIEGFHGEDYHRHAAELLDEREGYQIRLSSDFQPAARRNFLGRAHLAVNALVAEQLPIHGEVTARTRYIQAANSPYVPTWWGRWTVGGAILALIALVWWIGYNANRVFLANVANDGSEVGQEPTSPLGDRPRTEADWRGKWEDLTEYEQAILVRIIVDEGIVNPGQRPLVLRLLREGLLEFRPGLRPAEGLKQFLNQSGHNLNELADKELKAERVGWSQVRWVLLVIVFGASLFLFTTQPEFPTWITGAATAIASLVSVLLRLRDSLGTWFSASAKGL